MTFSIFTPFHKKDITFLLQLYETLKEQTLDDWEWVLVPNGEGLEAPVRYFSTDPRVKVYPFEYAFGKVGACKRYACQHSVGDYVVEVDWDDLLTPDCLEKLKREVDKDAPDFIFSHFCYVDLNINPIDPWSNYFGWTYRDYNYKGKILRETINPPFVPQNISRIWFNANHVRAWKNEFYKKVGGHNQTMTISDDHDLMLRSYLYGKCRLIDDCLYIHRYHPNSTTWTMNEEIQATMWECYDKYIWKIMEKWADDNKLRKIDLGGAINAVQGYETYDRHKANIIGDLDARWNLEDNSVGVLRAHDAIEHYKSHIHTMNEAWRVLAHGGAFMILVPSTDGMGAFSDPTHVSFWNLRSFQHYTRADMRRFLEPECYCKFQVMKLVNTTMWGLPYVEAHLIAVKDGRRFYGEYNW